MATEPTTPPPLAPLPPLPVLPVESAELPPLASVAAEPIPMAVPFQPAGVVTCPQCRAIMPATSPVCPVCRFNRFPGAPAPRANFFSNFWNSDITAKGGLGVLVVLAIVGLRGYLAYKRYQLSIARPRRIVMSPPPRVTWTPPKPVSSIAPAAATYHPPNYAVFPALSPPLEIAGGVQLHVMTIGGRGPAFPMQLRVYFPPGEHAPASLPCVFVAPAGRSLIHGMALTDEDIYEHLPYAQAGFAVVAYELSGAAPDGATDEQLAPAVQTFMQTGGGVANAEIAVNFALQRLPQVDASRLYCAGHSSAATVALHVAAADERIAGVCAYAPICDVAGEFAKSHVDPSNIAPGLDAFLTAASPINHVNEFHCPMFIFHSDTDERVPKDDNETFVTRLLQAGKQAVLIESPRGQHYDSMINNGIPQGIKFLIAHGARPAAAPASAAVDPTLGDYDLTTDLKVTVNTPTKKHWDSVDKSSGVRRINLDVRPRHDFDKAVPVIVEDLAKLPPGVTDYIYAPNQRALPPMQPATDTLQAGDITLARMTRLQRGWCVEYLCGFDGKSFIVLNAMCHNTPEARQQLDDILASLHLREK